MASTGTKRCLDCKAPLPFERSFVRCQACVERNMAAYHASLMTDTMAPTSPERDWMTPEEFRAWYEHLKTIDPKLTHAKLGDHLEVKQPTITRWMNGDGEKGRRIEHGAMLKLALERLEQKLIEDRQPRKRRHRRPAPGAGEQEP